MKISICLLSFIFFIMLPRSSFALCVGSALQNVPSSVTFQGASNEYDVYDTVEHMQTVNFQVIGGATVINCNYFITLSAGSSGTPTQRKLMRGADILNYNVYTSAAKANILKDISTAGAGDIITGVFTTALGIGQTQNQNLYWTINPQQIISAGTSRFQDASLTINLYEGLLLGVYLLASSKTITFQSRAESDVDLSLVDTGGGFNIGDTAQTVDFGTLTSGKTLSYDTIIRSNAGYSVAMQSQNHQAMKYIGNPSVTTAIPYTVSLGGNVVNLSSGAAVIAATAAGTVTTPATGLRFGTILKVGTLNGAEPAGNYQDIITVTVSAN